MSTWGTFTFGGMPRVIRFLILGRDPAYQPLRDASFDKGNMRFYGELSQPMYLHPQDVAENSAGTL